MATNQIYIQAPPEQVFDLLSDPRTYGHWVVGAKQIQATDGHWPKPGASFDHRVGWGPLFLSDRTCVLSASPPERLELLARAAPLPPARIEIQLRAEGGGTHLRMEEHPANRLLSLMLGPLGHWALWARNVESLRRLRSLAEGETPLPTGRLPERDGDGGG